MIEIGKYNTRWGLKYRLRIGNEVFKEGPNPKGRSSSRLKFYGPKDSSGFEIEIEDPALIKIVAEHTFVELPQQIEYFAFMSEFVRLDSDLILGFDYIYAIRTPRQGFEVHLPISPSEKWKAPFTRAEFLVEFRKRLQSHYRIESDEDDDGLDFGVAFRPSMDSTIEAELIRHRDKLQVIHDQTTAVVTSNQKESVALFFDFPESVRVACEQYLLYFAQFLKDLGVEADTALTHEAGHVLFTVTPTDQNEALDKIQSALDLYLELPTNPITDSINESIEVQRLESNILKLRSDLKLAAAEVQAKDATIRAQNLIIEVQKGLLTGEVLTKSIRDITPRPEDKEEVIPGILALSTYEEKGVRINLGEMLRRLKTFFSND